MEPAPPLEPGGIGVRSLLPSLSIHRNLISVGPAVAAGVWIVLPLGFGLLLGQLGPSVLASIGALNVLLILLTTDSDRWWKVLSLAAILNAIAFTAGAGLGMVSILLAVPLSGVAILIIEVMSYRAALPELMIVVSACFVIGLGLRTSGSPFLPAVFASFLIGGAWALVLVAVANRWRRVRPASFPAPDPLGEALAGRVTRSQWASAVSTGAAISIGLAIGVLLKLPRDYWVLLTIVVVMRSSLTATLERMGSRITGTILGAGIGGVFTVLFLPPWAALPILGALLSIAIIVQRANYLLYALFLTPFVVVLLNLLAPAGITVAVDRVVDTLIGGLIGAVAAFIVGLASGRWNPPVATGRPAVPEP
ncbi:MAG: FUSC family protein [Thermoplasmata archaeon]